MSEVILIVKEDADKVIVEIIELTSGYYFDEVKQTGYAYQKAECLCNLILQYRPKKVIFNKEKVSVSFMESFLDMSSYRGFSVNQDGTVEYSE